MSQPPAVLANGLDELLALKGTELGPSPWIVIDQERIDLFGRATGSTLWTHSDPERAARGPFGATIAQGFLIVSLFSDLLPKVVDIQGFDFGVNYGCNRIRFTAPVRVGSRLRMRTVVPEVTLMAGGVVNCLFLATFETEGETRPACIAEVILRYYLEGAD